MMSNFSIHPASKIPFSDLIIGLEKECELGNVNKRTNGPLTQYTYTQACTYNNAWNEFSKIARGIIVDQERIVALPFPKFFGIKEQKTIIPEGPFKTYEKVDGSMIIVYWYNNQWNTATKGSFQSDQARWANKKLTTMFDNLYGLHRNITYIFEAVYPENRIVVNYGNEKKLVLLGAYDLLTGEELDINSYLFYKFDDIAQMYSFDDMATIIEHCVTLPATSEGYVIRWEDGTRVKVKGDEYCRLHRMISNITPLAIWEMLMKNDSMEFMRSQIPEEFIDDYDQIISLIMNNVEKTINTLQHVNKQTKHLTDKELGLILHTLDDDVRKLIFPFRKFGGNILDNPKSRETVFRLYRPNANKLPEYKPSSAMNRIQDEG